LLRLLQVVPRGTRLAQAGVHQRLAVCVCGGGGGGGPGGE
jgi:hypothetical protein